MKIVELILDESQDNFVEAISVVEHPAIEEDFVALKSQDFKFAEQDKERKILIGPILIPNKPIYRQNEKEQYYIYFNRNTVRKASQLYLKQGHQGNSTLEHESKLSGLTLVESWIVEDKENDKSNMYGMDVPLGTWMGSVKVDNDEIWNNYVKTGKVKGFSIEGYFADKMERPKEGINDFPTEEDLSNDMLEELTAVLRGVKLKTYNDYPQAAVNNAKRALKYKKENGSSCGTSVGWTRANQLSKKEKISRSTIARMASFKRHEKNKDVPYTEGCGGIMYDAWGGAAGVNWAISKLKQIDKEKLEDDYIVVSEDYAIINNRLAYPTQEIAEQVAKDLGCKGFHTHDIDDKTWYMPCEYHAIDLDDDDNPCWDGYEMVGTKELDGRIVPNCVPIK